MFEHTYDDATPASVAIIKAICAIENVDPIATPENLDFTLYDHVDPNALDTIVSDGTGDGDVVVEFTLEDYHVAIADSGRIRIQPY